MTLATKLSTVLLALVACSNSTEPNAHIVGAYSATYFTISRSGSSTDALAAGAKLTLTLTADGHTSGTLHVPSALGENGIEQDFSLTGTWHLDDDSSHISFAQAADTFVPEASWTVSTTTLAGIFTNASDGSVTTAILTRTNLSPSAE